MAASKYVILGGGMVAGYAAKELAERGLSAGELSIVSSDNVLPYERPPLSKGFLAGKEDEASIFINQPDFYAEHGIEVRLSCVVGRLDVQGKRLLLQGGDTVQFEKLLIATGTRLRMLDIPGATLAGICYLRSLDDAKRIRTRAAGAKRAVVIGGGFIGMEVASVLAQQGVATTMIFPEARIWERFFTPEMSNFFQRYYEERHVEILPGLRPAACTGEERVSAVTLDSGQRLPADLVVAGIGVIPATEALQDTGLELQNGVVVNEYLETSIPGIYAAGDVASYRDPLFGKQRRAEHWDNAVEQGTFVARALTGEHTPFIHVPYFFSDVFDLSYEYWGDAEGSDTVGYRGETSSGRFSAWWLKNERLKAAFFLNQPGEEHDGASEWIAEQRQIPAGFLQGESRLSQ
jgi:NADPH-dependent 2,4-dienoyl-CoA reductase/sulfur reductase-like enzyme